MRMPKPGMSASHTIRRLPACGGLRCCIARSVSGFFGVAIAGSVPNCCPAWGQLWDNNMVALQRRQSTLNAIPCNDEMPIKSRFTRRWCDWMQSGAIGRNIGIRAGAARRGTGGSPGTASRSLGGHMTALTRRIFAFGAEKKELRAPDQAPSGAPLSQR